MLAPSLLAALGACGRGCARLAGPDAAAWRLLDVTAGALLAAFLSVFAFVLALALICS